MPSRGPRHRHRRSRHARGHAGPISSLTGIPQGRLSEYKTGTRKPRASTTYRDFADGLGMPPAARTALGLDPEQSGSPLVGRKTPGTPLLDAGLAYPDTPLEAAGHSDPAVAIRSGRRDPVGETRAEGVE